MTRRDLLLSMGLLPAVSFLASRSVGAMGTPTRSGSRIRALTVVEDSSLEASRRFASVLGGLGADTVRHAGDVSALAHLGMGRWGQRDFGCTAGLGHRAHAFIVERLAWSADLRVVGRGIHWIEDGAIVRHEFSGLLKSAGRGVGKAGAGRDWPAVLAEAVAAARLPGHPALPPLEAAGNDDAIVSWVLMPRRFISA